MGAVGADYVVVEAVTPKDYEEVGQLVVAYLKSLPFEITFQDVQAEFDDLRARYGPPAGAAFLARSGSDGSGAGVGVVALRTLEPSVGEVKRMYVTPEHRGAHLGRRLMESLIVRAPKLGMSRLRLDTVTSLTEANALYERLGFVDIPAYNDNPRPDARFMELVLA